MRINVGTDYQERYTFDQYKRTTSTIRTIGSQAYTTSGTYNQASQPLQTAFGTVAYDSAGRVSSIAGAGGVGMSSMTYNIAGQVTGDTLTSSGWNNGYLINSSTVETYGYDTNRMQLISQTAVTTNTNATQCVPPPCPPPPPGGTNLSLNYSYQASAGQMGVGTTAGNAGQLMSISGTIGGLTESANYTYDNYGRLATASQTSNGSSTNRRFYYDRWGNRTMTYQYLTQIQSINLQTVSFPGTGSAPTNRITSVTSGGTLSYTYDANGNVTNDGAHSYTYDSENRLVNVDNGAAVYAYDHQNRRYKKTIGSSVTHNVWEGSQVVGEYNGNTGAVLVQYGYAGSRMIAKTAGGLTQYFLSDRLSMRLALSDVGVVVGRQATLPFGEDFAESGSQEKHHFTSYERDAESGSDYALNRQYSQNVARFMSSDRYGPSLDFRAPQSLNRYSYVRNEPIDIRDPSGLNLEFFEGCTAIPIVVFNPETGAMAFAGLSAYSYCTIGSNNPTRGEPSLEPGTGVGKGKTPAEIANKAIHSAKRKLKKKSCKDLFDKIDPESLLTNSISIDTKDSGGQPFNSELTAAITISDHDANGNRLASGSITLNQNSFFFSGTVGGKRIEDLLTPTVRENNGLGDLDLDDLRTLGLLHELMHVNDTAGKYDDSSSSPNPDLNNLIRQNCF